MSADYFQNREISWLRFNERVLDEAYSENVRPLEKLKFISIFTSNLTEFFMVRIGSLTEMSRLKKGSKDNKTGMTANEQIKAVLNILPKMYEKKDLLFKAVSQELSEFGIHCKDMSSLSKDELTFVKDIFNTEMAPLLSPQIIDSAHPFPFLENDTLYIFLEMQAKKKHLYGLIPVRRDYSPYLILPDTNSFSFIMTEKIILHFADELFSGLAVKSKAIIKITRNFDFTDSSDIRDEFENYKDYMKGVIKRRKRQEAVRVESNSELSDSMMLFLEKQIGVPIEKFFISKSPLKMEYAFKLDEHIPSGIKEKISNIPFTPLYKGQPVRGGSMMEFVEKKDLMLYYPYDHIRVFLNLMKEASQDPRVISIKVTIYRLAKNSKLVKYLCDASENGKDVTVFMELKARFDEENNINYSEILYDSGCNIIYGFEQFKTHSKLCLITYKDKLEVKFITQIGTGNYNESTSKLYTDLSLITCNKEIGLDASDFFKNMATGNISGRYVHLLQSPYGLKPHLLELMENERKKGKKGRMFFKVNSLTDKELIEKLVECSKEGVKIKMIIRGISCLLPGIPNETDNIEIHSIVGRFLEHSRIYIFGSEKNKKYYIASADMMTRNMERRIEIAAPVYDTEIQAELDNYVNIQFNDNIKGRKMNRFGEYQSIPQTDKPISAHDYFMEQSRKMFLASCDKNDNKGKTKKTSKGIVQHIISLLGKNK
ncbi:MAG: polyphosphate kinase 1 [Treponema sp.]|nr:MAG: polyphosphate kinase 1 [Treponema sp.]